MKYSVLVYNCCGQSTCSMSFFFFNYFIVVHLQLSTFSPHPFPPPQPNPPLPLLPPFPWFCPCVLCSSSWKPFLKYIETCLIAQCRVSFCNSFTGVDKEALFYFFQKSLWKYLTLNPKAAAMWVQSFPSLPRTGEGSASHRNFTDSSLIFLLPCRSVGLKPKTRKARVCVHITIWARSRASHNEIYFSDSQTLGGLA